MPDPNAPISLRDSIDAAATVVDDAQTGVLDDKLAETDAAETRDTPDAADRATDDGRRTRGPDGKFTTARVGAAARPSPGGTADTPAHLQTPVAGRPALAGDAGAVPPAAAAVPAPASWKPETKAHWDALPPAVKEEVARREREMSTRLTRASAAENFAQSIMQEFQPYEAILRQEGASPTDALRTLLETAYTLRHGSPAHKHALFLSLAQQYGIDLSKEVDPNLARAQWEADSLKHAQMRQGTQNQSDLQSQIMQEIDAFRAAPGHEHYEAVRQHMIALLANGAANNLQEAYDQAVWANPKTRESMMSAQVQAENLGRAAKLGKNRNATLAMTGAPGSATTDTSASGKNLRETIAAAFEGGRV